MKKYDVIIIGGGPAGSTAASHLADLGHKVLLLEKEIFPREHIGESLIPASYATLQRLGVLEELKRISPRKPGVHFINSDGVGESLWCFKSVLKDDSYLSFHVKRSLFDEMLLKNSRKKGAEVQEGSTVKNVVLNDPSGDVTVDTLSRDGKQETFQARFLVDASGQSTFLASRLGVKKSFNGLDRVAIWSHWSGITFDEPLKQGVIKIVYLGGEKKGWFWVIPLSSENLSVGVVLNNSYVKEEKKRMAAENIQDWKTELFAREIAESPAVKKLLQNAHMDHKVQVNGDYSYYSEKKFGDNYCMIGDAGAFLDPIFSSGIFVGMRGAELVSAAIHEKLINDNQSALSETYAKINGAVNVLEKFIKLFYTPEVFNFSTLDPNVLLEFEKSSNIYSLFHFLLAGDFFEDHQKYSSFLDSMHNYDMIKKFRNLISYKKEKNQAIDCGERFDEMYGEMKSKLVFDTASFS